MGNIPVEGLIKLFQRMYHEHWPYVWGAAREGCVDCSGAFVWAYERFRKSIAHGSNAIARQYVRELLTISQAKPGVAAFKYYPPGHPKWNLPAKYRKGGSAYNGDLNDYYHVGLADNDPRYILNAQSTKTGFVRSKAGQGWTACGYLKAVDYKTEDEKKMETMIVTSPNGKKVRVRSAPGTTAPIIDYLECGTTVQAEPELNGWRKITCTQVTGYMMSDFLKPAEAPDDGGAYVKTLTTEEYNSLCAARDEIEDALKRLKAVVGVG